MKRLLSPLSLPYYAGLLIAKRFTTRFRLSRPVISIGNITWGGTGKTPVAIALAQELIRRGLKPAVLSRGYRRKGSNEHLIVSDGTRILSTPEACGDEPYLIAQSVPQAAVVVGADRYAAGELAFHELGADVFILDDGFQHWRLTRTADVVCVNALNPFGNGLLIPAGILREPLSALSRAHLIVLTNTQLVPEEKLPALERTLHRFSAAPIIRSSYTPSALMKVLDLTKHPVELLKGKNVAAFSGIAEHSGFSRMLEQCGMTVTRHIRYRDHHWYSTGEIEESMKTAPTDCPFVTTAKDAVRLRGVTPRLSTQCAERIYALEIDLSFSENGAAEWQTFIQKILP